MKILILNLGSSSIKYKIFVIENNNYEVLLSGLVEEKSWQQTGIENFIQQESLANNSQRLDLLFTYLKELNILSEIKAIGHRVVHGGTIFTQATLINRDNLATLKSISNLAPLHNPDNVLGIKYTLAALPTAINYAIFDTSFHANMPKHATTYAIDYTLAQKYQIKRYGFHGISHNYVSYIASQILAKPLSECNLISLHLGNGASICAIKNGKSIDTSMGMTPLEGLVMGTRSGDIDPYIVSILTEEYNNDINQVNYALNKKSGLFGLCGSYDLRTIELQMADNHEKAKLAFDVMSYRIVKYIGSYYALLPKIDAIIFTGGIGENSIKLKQQILKQIKHLGVDANIDNINNNYNNYLTLTNNNSKIQAFAIRTNEELAIAQEVYTMIKLI